MSDTFPTYALEVVSAGLRTRVLWNDWPAHRAHPDGRQVTDSVLLNPMVLEGKNRLRVVAEPLPDFVGRRLIEVDLVWVLGQEERVRLYSYRFEEQSYPLFDEGPTELFRQDIELLPTFGPWAWESARPYMNSDRPAVIEALLGMHAALESKDFARFVALCQVRLEEQARATNRDAGLVVSDQVKLLGGLAGIAGTVAVLPIDPAALVLESAAGGRLVEIFTKDYGTPLTVLLDGEEPMSFPMTMACIDGRWQGVR